MDQKQLTQQTQVFISALSKEAETTSKNPFVKPFFKAIKYVLDIQKLLHARVSLLESKGE